MTGPQPIYLNTFHVDHDGHGEPTIFTSASGPIRPVIRRCDIPSNVRELVWPAIVYRMTQGRTP